MVNMMRSGILRLGEGGTVPWYINALGSGSKGEGETAEEKARREFLEDWFEEKSLAVPAGQEQYDAFADVLNLGKEFELWLVYDANYPGQNTYPGQTVPDPTTSTDTNEVDTNEVDTNEVDTNEVDTNEVDTNGVDTNGVDTNGVGMDEITVVENFPTGVGIPGELVKYLGTIYIYNALTGWTPKDGVPGGPADNSTIDEITSYGTQPDSMWSGIDWSSLLSGVGGIAGLASLLGWEGLGGGDDKELSWWEKLFEVVKSKKAIDDYNKYQVPTGQMASQSAVGKDWGLPSKESMVMQGLGPNVLQGQKYAMNKGAPMPAATHVGGMPLLEKIEGGEQGGIMGLKSHGDITPAFLEPGEFVFTKKATDNVGAKRLYKLMQQAEQMGMR